MPRMPHQSARQVSDRRRLNYEREREALRQNRIGASLDSSGGGPAGGSRFDESERFETNVRLFENEMRHLDQLICPSCLQRKNRSDANRRICRSCQKGNLLFTAANGMDLGEVPPELAGLTLIEQMLIARVNPVISVFKIMGQQSGYSGHVMNFIQRVDQIATRLPHATGNLMNAIIISRATPEGVIHFRVRSNVVRSALVWLKTHNQYYRDIVIDEESLSELPVDGNLVNRLPSLNRDDQDASSRDGEETGDNINHIEHSGYPNLPNLNMQDAIARSLRRLANSQVDNVGAWPEVEPDPLNEFTHEGIVCMSFPALFPYGRGDINAPRLHSISWHKYCKYLMKYHDGRFAKDMRFPYYAYNTTARHDAMNCGSIYIRQHQLLGLNAAQLGVILDEENPNLAANMMYYGVNLRGTRQYWKQRCAELLQMVRQIGTPTVFFTLSAADYQWPDLFRILIGNAEIDVNSLTNTERRTLMHQNPSTVAWFFDQRCDIFMRTFIKRMFDVKDFWYRYEWQHRGSPHIHGLLWLTGAPDRDNIDTLNAQARNEIISYFDDKCSAWLNQLVQISPDSNPCRQRYTDLTRTQKLDDLDRLLSAVQRHSRHGSHCLRAERGGRNRRNICRFGFPMNCEEVSALRREAGAWKFFPRRNDTMLQRYNKFITQGWRGNTDFAAVTSPDAVINYIAKYASKAEHASPAFGEILRAVINRNSGDAPASRIVKQLLISSVAERNYSGQEVTHLLLGAPLYHSSRTCIVLGLREDWRRFGVINTNTTVDHYAQRSAELENLSLFEYAKRYYRRSGVDRRRQEDCIVRVIPYLKLGDDPIANEEYYKLQCKLNIPWRESVDELRDGDTSWEDLYIARINLIDYVDPYGEEYPHVPDEIEFEQPPDNNDDIVRDINLAAARIPPNPLPSADPLGHRHIDEAQVWHQIGEIDADLTENQLDNYFREFYNVAVGREVRTDIISYEMFSPSQQEVIDICRDQISNPGLSLKRVLVQGKAGTGKSAIIKLMCQIFDELDENIDDRYEDDDFEQPPRLYQVLAPTGAAAVNVDGKTIHSFFRLPTRETLTPLVGPQLRAYQNQFSRMRWIIIDEYSMIGLRLLTKIHKRLCEARGSSAEPFGGYNIFLFGDLRQLPPVLDTAIYMDPVDDFSALGLSALQSFQHAIILDVVHRQSEDERAFKQALDNIACGSVREEDWRLLLTRRRAMNAENIQEFNNSINLFPTNALVANFNERKLSQNQQAVARINAVHNNSTAAQGSDVQAQNLQSCLFVSIGCRVMLRKNISVDRGLVNGSLGSIRDIIYAQDEQPPALPRVILIEFDRFSGPFIRDRLYPLRPLTVTWRENSVDCSRKQFPINLAYALTIHKAQGLTLNKAVIDIGRKEMAPGLTYVALSRVRRLQDLIIENSFDFIRLSSIGRMRHIIAREAFLQNIHQILRDEISSTETEDA